MESNKAAQEEIQRLRSLLQHQRPVYDKGEVDQQGTFGMVGARKALLLRIVALVVARKAFQEGFREQNKARRLQKRSKQHVGKQGSKLASMATRELGLGDWAGGQHYLNHLKAQLLKKWSTHCVKGSLATMNPNRAKRRPQCDF